MESQGDLPYYIGIINRDIDIDSSLLGVSQNNPMSFFDSPPQGKHDSSKKAKRGSVDAIHSNEQIQNTFCQKVWEHFKEYNTSGTACTAISLISRWRTINKKTNRFCGCMDKVNPIYQNGMTEQDKL